MGKKRRNHPNLEELLSRPWCYYCERDFEDLKLLISHQKAKHFKCERCGRRLNTAGGLAVHMNQVHKETLTHVDNALDGRAGLEVEIFGMEGVPDDALALHTQQLLQAFHQGRAERQAAAAAGGGPGGQRPAKKIRVETPAELKQRLAAFRAQAGARQAAAAQPPTQSQSQSQSQPAAEHDTTTAPPVPAALPTALPDYAYAAALPSRPPHHSSSNSSSNSGAGLPGAFGLPQRPPGYHASTLDDLVSGAAAAHGGGGGDDIDKMIRMAEAGIRPPPAAAAAPPPATTTTSADAPDKKKKDKAMRMVYADGDFSLEERMAQLPRYVVAV